MALSPLRSKAVHHGRSHSLPSKSYLVSSQFDENLSIVKASEATSTSLSPFHNKLNGLKNLYNNLDDFLLLPHIQRTIRQKPQEKWVDQVLDDHIELLDACITAKDIFSHIKKNVQDLLSALRRKDVHGVHCFLASRKKSIEMIQKSLKYARILRSKNTLCLEKANKIVCMLKDAESVTFDTFTSLFSYVIGTRVQARQSGWSLVSKLMHSRKVSHQSEETYLNEFIDGRYFPADETRGWYKNQGACQSLERNRIMYSSS